MPYTYEKGKWVMDHVNAYSGAEDGVQQGSRIWQPVTNFALNKHSQPDLLKSIVETEYQRVRKVMDKNRKILEEKTAAEGMDHLMDSVLGTSN